MRIFVDTNVLFPFSVMDLMLALTEDGVHEMVWTEHLHVEWERVIVREQQRTLQAASSITNAIREFLDDTRIPEESYAHLVRSAPSPDPDDRHHTAAAIAAQVAAIVTWNTQDFPAGALRAYGIQVLDPDTYLCAVLETVPAEVLSTVQRLAAEKRRPPMTAQDLADRFAKAGAVVFADRLRNLLGG